MNMVRKRIPLLLMVIGALFSLVLVGCQGDAGSQGPEGARGEQGLTGPQGPAGEPASVALNDLGHVLQMTRAIAGTTRYMNVEAAEADGYTSTVECVESPAGTMGIHYVNPALIQDPSLLPEEPEILQYVKVGDTFKLVGLEYMMAVGPPDAPVPDPAPPAPMLFGQELEGPMAGHGPGQPPHFDLHAWAWAENPDGIFADFNPSLSCEA